ncbi:MAG: M20/M25/M40 family metallo-hydrolase [Pseudomonadota bacterium]
MKQVFLILLIFFYFLCTHLSIINAQDYLVAIDTSEYSYADLVFSYDIIEDRKDYVLALANNEHIKDLEYNEINYEIIDTEPLKNEYFFIYQYQEDDLELLEEIGKIIFYDYGTVLLKTSHKYAIIIAQSGFEISKLFLEPISSLHQAQAIESSAFKYNNDIKAMTDSVDKKKLLSIATTLVDFGTRKSTSPQGIEASKYIYNQFKEYGLKRVGFHDFDKNADNVVAVLPGNEEPEKMVIIGAHYDSLSSYYSTVAPGADDNASGTAAVLEAARIFSNYTFKYSIVFIAFASEELGLIGSKNYAQEARERGDEIIAMINIDMIGYLAENDVPDIDLIPGRNAQDLLELAHFATKTYIGGFSSITGSSPMFASSDHASFSKYGYKALWFFEDSKDDSPFIHSANDIMGKSLNNPEFFTNCTKSVIATAASLAEVID